MLSHDITDEELITVIAGAEGLLSSRPLTTDSKCYSPRQQMLKMCCHPIIFCRDNWVGILHRWMLIPRFYPQKRQCKVQESLKCGPGG